MENKISKEEIDELIKIPGKVRGQVFLTDFEYVKNKKGTEGARLLRGKIKEWGDLIDYEKINVTEWYPVGWRIISLLAIKEVFNLENKDFFDLGDCAPKYSFIVKMLMKYFLSTQKTFEEASNYWKKHYSVGEIETVEYNDKKLYFILRLKNFKIHPILCPYYEGYFSRIGKYVKGNKNITIREVKCMFSGDPYHEYLLNWKD